MTTGYLVYPTQQAAQGRSRAEALSRGCKQDDVTQYWWPVVENPLQSGQWLLLLNSRDDFGVKGLPAQESGRVQADPAVLAALSGDTGAPAQIVTK